MHAQCIFFKLLLCALDLVVDCEELKFGKDSLCIYRHMCQVFVFHGSLCELEQLALSSFQSLQ